MKKIACSVLMMLLCSPVFAGLDNAEHRLWQHIPIKIVLPVNKDRLISFPGSVTFNPNNDVSLTKAQLHIINNDGVLYLRAKQFFSSQLVEVKLNKTGNVVLINLSAKAKASDVPVSILLSDKNKQQKESYFFHSNLAYVHLTRFAIGQLYAPKRLLHDLSGVYRVSMRTDKTVSLVLGAKVIAMPLISWGGGDYYETAVLLRNQLKHPISVSPHDLLGHWVAISFYPGQALSANNQPGDTTTVFLISNAPFMTALEDDSL